MRARYDATPVLIITARDRRANASPAWTPAPTTTSSSRSSSTNCRPGCAPSLRRSSNTVVSAMRRGDVAIEPARQIVTRAGREVSLSAHEYRTLLALMERMGQTVSREQLEVAVYGGSGTIESNTVAVYVHQLRRKLGEGLIVTAHGVGYRIETGDTP